MSEKKMSVRIIKILVILLLVILAVFILLKVVFGNDKGIKFSSDYLKVSDPKTSLGTVPSDETVSSVLAENDNYKLEYTPSTDLIVLTDKINGTAYRSYPAVSEGELTGNGIDLSSPIFRLTSPVVVRYTQNGDSDDGDVGINQVVHEKTVNKIEDGFQLVYSLPQLSIRFVVEFTIDSDGLQVNVPRNGIVEESEDGEARLLSLTVLPYFLSTRSGDEGYYVLPDGCGGLTYFDQPRLTSFSIYEKKLYGYDVTFDKQLSPDYVNMSLSMPVAGRIINGDMVSMYSVEGEAGTALVMVNPGKNSIPFYGLAYKFHLRQIYTMTMSKSGSTFYQYEDEFGIGDATVRYYFNHKTDGAFTYVDLAEEARGKLLKEWAEDFGVTEKASKSDGAIMTVKVFLAAENRTGGVVDSYKVLTTFNQVKEIYEELKNQGVDEMRISLLGWQNGGYYGNICDKFPADSGLGGNSDLEKLIAWADENNIELSLDYNPLLMYGEPSNGVSLRSAAVKEPGTIYLNFNMATSAGVYRNLSNFYIMSPLYYEKEFLNDDIEELKDLNVGSVELQNLGNQLFTDYNKSNALTRQQTMHHFNSWLNTFSNNFKNVSVYYGNDYAAAIADRIIDIPTTSSSLQLIDEAVPFIQIVYHGIIDYYCEPINRSDNEDVSYLKAVEYGAMLSYELTYNSTEELKYTYYDKLFKSQYSLLSSDIGEKYGEVKDYLKSVKDATITNHYKLEADKSVYCTEFSNGIKVYVNYETSAYSSETLGITVAAQNFTIVGV